VCNCLLKTEERARKAKMKYKPKIKCEEEYRTSALVPKYHRILDGALIAECKRCGEPAGMYRAPCLIEVIEDAPEKAEQATNTQQAATRLEPGELMENGLHPVIGLNGEQI